MGWWDKWLGGDKTAAVVITPPDAQTSMTLDERMAFRRQMVLESVCDVMTNHGLLSQGFRASVARLDARGHQYAVMVDMMPLTAGRNIDAPGELLAMESRIADTARHRYKIKVAGVYWRVVLEHTQPVAATVAPAATSVVSAARAAPVAPTPAAPKPVFLRRKNDHPGEDGFPDTRFDAHRVEEDEVTAEELMAFERALSEGSSPQSVSLGRRTYKTDFSPLV